ncbi:uncharacterized protein LOC133846107 [Drosophila sulfurigaster albostrigata]|uniref:uncharacterized protein LOC133846107 n=1 Tax=Drosophila sulfurigaster albostrigata TaxID=89887 RepID=UPI002D21D1A6|nr:uncharacterized protein LOC133846107 [Drosophila sulfurigaster albostrigata]XP_062136843.1 uncharacterized protein LOC133846107 [Drosophila sulfurigaster albostrigata]XP_062136844.1 uncharacterized protein LOC133846107 [Drosophila sulfurigaster albostrigata]
MRERSQTAPRRRRAGPKQALPVVESPYNIDNTEDIYGTTLLPSQRCYVDPWDLENYDYVRKKMDTDVAPAAVPDYETALDYEQASQSPSPTAAPVYGYGNGLTMASTMPRPHTRRVSRNQCQLECCRLPTHVQSQSRSRSRSMLQKEPIYAARSELYGAPPSRYDDYMATMTRQLHLDDDYQPEQDLYAEQRQLYNGYGGVSSASSTEQHSSIGGDEMPSMPLPRRAATLQRRPMPSQEKRPSYGTGYGTAPHPRRKRSAATKSMAANQAAPQIDFPAPPPLSPAYDYCNPYATMPYCSLPDCAECQQQATSLIYAAPSTLYGTLAGGRAAAMQSSDSPSDSSLYAGIYARKFGLSKKGLLQIDYSCSWNDLDRVMGRNY